MKQIKSTAVTLPTERIYVASAFTLLLILFGLYIYFVSASVWHVVMRQEMQQHISQLHSEISQLEAEYIAAQHSVSDEIATLEGYVVAEKKIFIDRTDPAVALSVNPQ